MDTYFIRHTEVLDIDDDTRNYLWSNHKIAIHFPWEKKGKDRSQDSTSLNPDDYESSDRRAVQALVNLARDGGYVCAQHVNREESMLGFVEPGSKIQLFNGKWGDRNGMRGRTAILKTLQLTKMQLIKPLHSALLLVGRPRQGTIMRWPSAGRVVEYMVEGRSRQLQLCDLHYSQQEILCSEFLRTDEAVSSGLPRLTYLLLPPGRTMKDIDIAGIADDGKMLMAQVTYSTLDAAQSKIDRLSPYEDPKQAHLVLFCKCDNPGSQKGVKIYPIEQAFNIFISTKLGKRWLERAI